MASAENSATGYIIRLQKRLGSQLFRAGEGEGDGFLIADCNDCVMAFVAIECLVSGGFFLSSVNGLRFSRTGRGVDFSDVNGGDWRVSPCSVFSFGNLAVFGFCLSKGRGGGRIELSEFFALS